MPPHRWPRVQRDAGAGRGGWAQEALNLSWTTADLFGCDRRAPWHQLDRAGLVLLTGGHEIVELTEEGRGAPDIYRIGARFRRRPPARPPVALLWEILISARATGHQSAGRQLIQAKSGWRRRAWRTPPPS